MRAERKTSRAAAGRKERTPMGSVRQKLAAPERKGYHRHWFNDVGGRIKQAQDAGYTHVMREDAVEEDGRAEPLTHRVGVNEDGSPMIAYLMEIPLKYYREDQAAKQKLVDEIDDQIRQGAIAAQPGDNRYVPPHGITMKRD